MRIPSGSTDRYVYFVAVDATDLKTREQSVTGWSVYRSRNGAAAVQMTTPTINETDSTNMPGVYELLLDEDTTIAAGNDAEELCLHITGTGIAPITRVVELYRPETTEGNTLDVTATGAGGIDWNNVEAQGSTVNLSATTTNIVNTATAVTTVNGLAANVITAASIQDNAIDSGAFATDAINAAAVAADAIDLIWDEVIDGGAHTTPDSAGKRLRLLATSGSYADGAVWVDATNGVGTTNDYEDGTEVNPALWTAAQTIAGSVGLKKYRILPSTTTITFGAVAHANEVFVGDNWTLALGTVTNFTGTYVEGATVSGVAAGTGTTQTYQTCKMNATSHIAGTVLRDCQIAGTQTIAEAGDYSLIRCVSGVAGAGAPTIDMGGVGATTLQLRDWRGGVTVSNLASGDVVSMEGIFGTITLEGQDAQVEIRGVYKGLTNNLTGSPTVNDNATDISQLDTRMPTTHISATGGAVDTVTAVTDPVTVGTINTDVITAASLNADAANEIADALLSRNVSNVEGTAAEHTLCTVVLACLEHSVSASTWTIKRTDGATTHYTKTLTTDAAADPVTGVQ